MPGKARALLYLLGRAKGLPGKASLLRALLGGKPHPTPRVPARLRRVQFREFTLWFHVGQGQLTPYIDLTKEFVTLGPQMSGPVSAMNVLDVGANIGIFSLLLKSARRIIAVEPNPALRECLDKNFAENHVRGESVQKAVFSEECKLKMDFGSLSILAKISDIGTTEVEATTIDKLVERFNGEVVDFLKIDIEGHELSALRGASKSLTQRLIRQIYLEFWNPSTLKALDELLTAFGYVRAFTGASNALYKLSALQSPVS